MRKVVIAVSAPVLALILPEVFHNTFEWLRQQPSWPVMQVGCVLWIVVVVALSIPWRMRRESLALSFVPDEPPYGTLAIPGSCCYSSCSS